MSRLFDRTAALDGADLPLLPHRFGIDGGPNDLQRIRVHSRQKIEVDEAVVEWRQQCVRPGMGEPAEMGVAARRVDDHEVDRVDHLFQSRLEALLLVDLGGSAILESRKRHGGMDRHRQIDALALGVGGAVLDISAERGLPRIEIERGDAKPLAQERHGDMQRRRRLS
jgi:hypothetical protein